MNIVDMTIKIILSFQKSSLPASLSGGFQCTPAEKGDSAERNTWQWFHIQKVYKFKNVQSCTDSGRVQAFMHKFLFGFG